MKNLKKGLIGTAIAGTLVVGAAAGTFAWFNAEYTASGEITNHTLTINGETDSHKTLSFGEKKLAPSRTVTDSFYIENTGTMEQILRASLDLMLEDKNGNVMTPNYVKSVYNIRAHGTFTRDGVDYPFDVNGNADLIDQFLGNSQWLPDQDGADQGWAYFKPGDMLVVNLDVKLSEDAGNEYQGAKLIGGLDIDARQTDSGSEFMLD